MSLTTNNSENIGSIKVAFATNDDINIDAHFGSAKKFHIYEIKKSSFERVDIISIEEKDVDKTISLLSGVDILYFINIGAIAAAKIINRGIFTIKYKEIVSINDEVEKISNMLNSNPPPFIKKIIDKKKVA